MTVYYNEFDPKAAAWLRELMKQGHIAEGVVDERSIRDARPEDLAGYTQCHFFAGVGVWSYALRRAGWPDDRPVWTGSCPCQPFSSAGKRGGVEDERHLWPEFFRLISECKPVVVFGEQVASKDGLAWLDSVHSDLERAGYAVGSVDICAAGFGAPHIRQRLYFVAESVGIGRRGRSDGDQGWVFGGGGGVQVKGRGMVGLMADSPHTEGARLGQHGREILRNEEAVRLGQGGAVSLLGQPDSAGSQPGREAPSPLGQGSAAVATSGVGDLADLHDERPQRRGREQLQERTGECVVGQGGGVSRLANAEVERGGKGRQNERGSDKRSDEGQGAIVVCSNPGPVNGLWSDAEWIYCRDNKYRSVEPGTFPLAHGSPARVGRLRGYGNAIVAPVAQGFIEAYLETEGEIRGAQR